MSIASLILLSHVKMTVLSYWVLIQSKTGACRFIWVLIATWHWQRVNLVSLRAVMILLASIMRNTSTITNTQMNTKVMIWWWLNKWWRYHHCACVLFDPNIQKNSYMTYASIFSNKKYHIIYHVVHSYNVILF